MQIQDTFDVSITHEICVSVLNCDTITQAKEKILDVYHKESPYSKRQRTDDYDLVHVPNDNISPNLSNRIVLNDEDKTSKHNKDHKRLNTLSHYSITNGSLLVMYQRQPSGYIQYSCNNDSSYYSVIDNKNVEMMTLLSKSSSREDSSSSQTQTYSKSSMTFLNDVHSNKMYKDNNSISNAMKKVHLINPNDKSVTKLASEVYLPYLLKTKVNFVFI